MRDVIIIGGGPAGLSAAINLRNRGRDVLLVSNAPEYSGLWKAPRIDNYLGMPEISGRELLEKMRAHAVGMGVETVTKRVLSIMPATDKYFVSYDNEVTGARALVIACGIVPTGKLAGEAELLGRGVSYCATCDGMLYRGKRVIVTGNAPDAAKEANYLSDIGCHVTFAAAKKPELNEGVEFLSAKKLKILGEAQVTGVEADGETVQADGVFVLRQSIAPSDFLPGLEMAGGYITVNERFATNLIGVFAAGDCTGKPLQVAKAVGDGLVAGLSAADYLEEKYGKTK